MLIDINLGCPVLHVAQAQRICNVQVVELTEVAKEFLAARFEEFDKDKDGVLSPAEQDDMHSTSPSR